MTSRLISEWMKQLKAMTFEFKCNQCGYQHLGDRHNKDALCPGCEEGLLRLSEEDELDLKKRYHRLKKEIEEDECLSNLLS